MTGLVVVALRILVVIVMLSGLLIGGYGLYNLTRDLLDPNGDG